MNGKIFGSSTFIFLPKIFIKNNIEFSYTFNQTTTTKDFAFEELQKKLSNNIHIAFVIDSTE